MGWIWTCMLAGAVGCSLWNGTAGAVGGAAMEGARAAVELTVTLSGPMLLWSGLMELLRRAGATDALGRALSPVLARLYPSSRRDGALRRSLGVNLSANLLGLGGAATPAGINAAGRLLDRGEAGRAEVCRLVVMNTASLQLVPTGAASLRQALGSAAPFDILPAVWVSSVLSLLAGLGAERLLRR